MVNACRRGPARRGIMLQITRRFLTMARCTRLTDVRISQPRVFTFSRPPDRCQAASAVTLGFDGLRAAKNADRRDRRGPDRERGRQERALRPPPNLGCQGECRAHAKSAGLPRCRSGAKKPGCSPGSSHVEVNRRLRPDEFTHSDQVFARRATDKNLRHKKQWMRSGCRGVKAPDRVRRKSVSTWCESSQTPYRPVEILIFRLH